VILNNLLYDIKPIEKESVNMEKNKEIMQEFFFKKNEKVSDKLKKKFAYEPLDVRKEGQPGFGSILSSNDLAVTDAKEAGKRVVSAFGASMGVNSVKNIASKSIKSFPIIVSENLEPETSVMLKRVLEEQYAEYISLLISNQIIDISAFKTSEDEGNIAIQALGTVAADDETVQSKLSRGKVSPDEFLGNLTAYNLIRNESYKSNNAFLDNLLEDSFIVPSEKTDDLLEFYHRFYDDIVSLNEATPYEKPEEKQEDKRFIDLDTFLQKDLGLDPNKLKSRKEAFDILRGREAGSDEETQEHKAWARQLEYAKERLSKVEKEIEELRRLLNSRNANLPQLIDSANREVQTQQTALSLVRRRLNATSNASTQAEVDAQQAKLDQAERSADRLMSIRDNEPSDIRDALKSSERERDSIEGEIVYLERKEPAEKNKSEKFNRLTTPRLLIDREQMNTSLNSSVGEMLLAPKNEFLRDKFEKATFLLESNRIAGTEYIEYLVQRLGIPVGRDVRQQLLLRFKMSEVIDPENKNRLISRADVKRLSSNQTISSKIMDSILKTSGKTLLVSVLLGSSAAAGAYALTGGTLPTAAGVSTGISTGIASLASTLGFASTNLFITAATGVGVGAIAGIMYAIWNARKRKNQKTKKLQGWERVEALIDSMEEQQKSIRTYKIKNPDITQEQENLLDLSSSELKNVMDDYHDRMGKILNIKASATPLREDQFPIYDIKFENLLESIEEYNILIESIEADPDYQAILLSEAVIQTTIPQTLELKYEYDSKKAPEILAAPKFSQRSQYAYGSVEYDKRELKDRRYNAPLLMKVNFKERFSDGTFSDNELTAVIGILGVVTRVPSQEMEYILTSNADGNTVKGIFSPEGDSSKMVSDLLGVGKIKKDVKSLPVSGDVWQNLEKVSRLAVSNKLAGRRDNNIANAHIVFAQKEIDNIRANESIDYVKNIKLVSSLMKRYSAFTVMIANDISERLYIFDDLQTANWDVVPYSAFRNKDTGDQLNAMLNKMSSGRL
jgi:hypothetical protein